jgi:6-phosphogluconolactonase (cycloisomerase 2 family)
VATTADGKYLYAANSGDATLTGYSVGSGGNLSALSTASYSLSSGSAPRGLAIASSQYLYATQAGSAKLLAYSIDSSTGKLTALSPASVSTGTTPYAVALRSDGRCAYVANRSDNTVSQYIISSGVPTALASATVATGSSPVAITLSPDDRFAYVANSGASTVSVYSVGTSCDLSLITNVASGGSTPTSIVVR